MGWFKTANQHQVFVYGTLLDPSTRARAIGREVPQSSHLLKDYKKISTEINGTRYPNIVSSSGDSVEGVIITLSEKELNKLDKWENKEYKRIRINDLFVYVVK